MRLVLLGLPGAGKGTQANFLSAKFGVAHISTGDMLRSAIDAGAALGTRAKTYVEKGELVPDEIVIGLVKHRIERPDCATGFVIDGFPRTVQQATALEQAGVRLDYVIEIDITQGELLSRMSGRRVHPASGRVYHVVFNPPRVPGKDDVTGDDLVQRSDDQEETVKKRITAYHLQTLPLVAYYLKCSSSGDASAPRYIRVAGSGTVEAVKERLWAALTA